MSSNFKGGYTVTVKKLIDKLSKYDKDFEIKLELNEFNGGYVDTVDIENITESYTENTVFIEC